MKTNTRIKAPSPSDIMIPQSGFLNKARAIYKLHEKLIKRWSLLHMIYVSKKQQTHTLCSMYECKCTSEAQ
ncbi:hypothetical protein AXI59_07185 [Bacillus nakamurai]|uniref:Transposase n=1 Tax=Bacillus nakamurai TaxID=1793963 RepID=A0A150F756_9BACI|nr:hypothetical protein AXI58_15955 [Bacillus nakamurai]KXZ24088.1 hypothetical protein AXI59_07185 [Bacillus nakamurai]